MSRNRFNLLWSHIEFSKQPETRPPGQSSVQYHWRRVADFVKNFNDHLERFFVPSDFLCVDESMSRWYGLGGHWINIGLPMYVTIDRKPENGCEIQNVACGKSGVMLRLKIVTTAEDEGTHLVVEDSGLLHGTQVLKMLVMPWANTHRTVCADLYFSSVQSACEMKRIGLRYIGVVKTATTQDPMAKLQAIEMSNRGKRHKLISTREEGCDLLAFVWLDRERRYFISTTSSLEDGAPCNRERWRQVHQQANANAERVELSIPQPKACELYYSTCGMIDAHNRKQQDDIMVEKKLGTQDWSKRVNLSIFAMCVVNAFLVFRGCCDDETLKIRDFVEQLSSELILNEYDNVRGRRRRNSSGESPAASASSADKRHATTLLYLAPTKKMQKNNTHRTQGHCLVCRKHTTWICYGCKIDNPDKEPWICSSRTRSERQCFHTHLGEVHGVGAGNEDSE